MNDYTLTSQMDYDHLGENKHGKVVGLVFNV